MTPDHSARHTIKLKIRELHTQLATLTAALAIFNGKGTKLSDDDNPPTTRRPFLQDQFDAMMALLSARKGRSISPAQLRKELRAKGQHTGTDTTVFNHLSRAVKLGYVLKRGNKFLVSPTIQKITQKGALKPSKARYVNGVAAPKHLRPSNYDFVLGVLRAAEGPQKAAAIQTAANSRGASMKKDTSVYGFLRQAINRGMAKKSEDGYQITEKGKEVQ